MPFKIQSNFTPSGDQPQAINTIVSSFNGNKTKVTLLGVTGSGKTYTMANVIEHLQLPTLVISHNKTLAAQLYREFKNFFPDNAVDYFVSYFDYYQPEAYLPKKDLYIEKDSSINDEIERLRLKATESLLSRNDVIVVATVSCIYGIGNPEEYKNQRIFLKQKQKLSIETLLYHLVSIFYERGDYEFKRGSFRVRGDIVDIFPAYAENALRVSFFGEDIESLSIIDSITSNKIKDTDSFFIYPARHFVSNPTEREHALKRIEEELTIRYQELLKQDKKLEAERLLSRTNYDLEIIHEIGYVKGIENYSRHFSGRFPGQPPATLIDYFPDNFLLIIDESHVTIPQLHGMYAGDFARKKALIEYGFRLPSAFDHRPLKFNEIEKYFKKIVFVSATPGIYEKSISECIAKQIIRPTGLLDPQIIIRPSSDQIKNVLEEINQRIANDERILVLTLTKKNAEDLAKFLQEKNLPAAYLHSEIETLERIEIIKEFRGGKYKILIGINLLREGIDLPEVTVVAILDADKVGFLRSETSLIQMMGRAARNVNGTIIMYADEISLSMQSAINETNVKRSAQIEYNEKHNITPTTIKKELQTIIEREKKETITNNSEAYKVIIDKFNRYNKKERNLLIKKLTEKMLEAARKWEFEEAAFLRDKINELKSF